jgi:very-short-patch-repair endonuclease
MSDETPIFGATQGKSASRSVHDLIGRLAEAQHGVVSRRQLLELGVGRGAVEEWVARGQLRRVQWGVYAVGHRPTSRESRWMAVVLSAGPGAVLSHRSAGALWRILPPMSILPEVTRATRIQVRSGLRGHCQMEVVLNEMEVRGITDKLSIPDLLERYPRRRGSAKLRALLADQTTMRGVTREELEARFLAALDGTDLPRPRLNADVTVRGRFFEADCLWVEQRVIVELDGRAAHGTRRAFERDRERDRLLQADGWRVVRITWRQLHDDAPAVIADLRRLLRHGGGPPTL